MNLIEAINQVDNAKPNDYTQEDKVRWLSNLDWTIKTDVIDTHEGAERVVFDGYDEGTPLETELLAPSSHSDIYPKWLAAQIDYANGEYGKYANSMEMFNAAYSAFERFYNRTHMPLGRKFSYFGR